MAQHGDNLLSDALQRLQGDVMVDEEEVFGLDDDLPSWAEEDADDVPPDEPDDGDEEPIE